MGTKSGGVQRRKLSKGYKWRYHLYHKGKKVFSPSVYDNEAEALKARRDHLIELASSSNTSLFYLISERLKDLQLENKTEKYQYDSEHYLEILKDTFGNIPIQTISKGKVKGLLNSEALRLQGEWKQNYAVNYLLRVTKSFFQYCINYQDIEMLNPCRGIRPFHIQKQEKYIPTDREIDVLKNQLNPDQQALIDFVKETGCRITEALNLKAEHLNFERGTVTLFTRKSRDGNLTFRKIKIPECFLNLEINLPKSGKIFHWRTRPKFIEKKIHDLNNDFYGISASLGVKIMKKWNWHNLRHKWASEAAIGGMPILMIMYNLGHTNYITTQIYLNMLGVLPEANSWGDSWADSADINQF